MQYGLNMYAEYKNGVKYYIVPKLIYYSLRGMKSECCPSAGFL